MAHRRLSNPQYKNWVTVGRAIQITCGGLENIVQKAVDNYHIWLLTNLPKNVDTWRSHLERAHRSTDKVTISWNNSNESMWFSRGGPWEIAKIFMAPLGPGKRRTLNAQTTDITGLLNLLEWSPILDPGSVNPSAIADARKARNTWAHAPQLRISDAEKIKAFASFTFLLQDPKLCRDKRCQDAINELNKLLNDGLAVIEEKELELLVELQSQLAQDVVSLDSEITYWKDQVDANSTEIETLRESLDLFIKNNKLQKDIETVKTRIDKVEQQMIQHNQSTNIRLKILEENASSEPEQFVCDGKSTLKFNPVCDRMKEEFVGREWLFSDIDSWLEKDLGPRESRAFSVRGGPGTGKSSIAQELVRRQQGKQLAGYHFFQKDNPRTYDLESLVDNLSRMLSDSLPAYAALVGRSYLQDANKFRDYPVKLFDYLITTPLQQLQENTKRFLLIGALDEGGPITASCFARMSAALPAWLRVIFTARTNATALFDLFPDCTCANLDFINGRSKTKTFHNLEEDMRIFVTMKHEKLQKEHHDYVPLFFKNNTKTAIRKIVDLSQDCFLYAKLVMEHIFAGHTNVCPSTLSEIYCLDFRRLCPDEKFFKTKVAPIIEVVLAITRVIANLFKETRAGGTEWFNKAATTSGTFLETAIKMDLLSGITMRDLSNALQKLSVYLFQNSSGVFNFSHISVAKWLQEKNSHFYCDENKGHSNMAAFHLEMLKRSPLHLEDTEISLVYYLSHSSFLLKPRSTVINFLISKFGIKATDLLRVALCHTTLADFATDVIDETGVLDKLSLEEKAQQLHLAITSHHERVAATLIGSANWVFSLEVHRALIFSETMKKSLLFFHEKGSLPQLLFSVLCGSTISHEMIMFCGDHGVLADVCLPKFFKNTEHFDARICWNEQVQGYFRKLKSGEKNVITLESLKENPSFPEEARIDNYTLEIIQKPISEVERLVKVGECYVCFTYGWHVVALKWYTDSEQLDVVDLLLKHGADVNNRGNLGKTALMMACESQNRDLISLLLDHGAKVNEQDFYGSTALHHVLERKENSEVEPNSPMQVDIIGMLLEHEADPHLRNSRDVSAIDIAEQEGGIVLEKLTGKRRRTEGSETDQDTL